MDGISVEAVVVIPGANLIVVGNRLGITAGEDLAEAAVGNATENVSPGGVKENVVLCVEDEYVALSEEGNVEGERVVSVGSGMDTGGEVEKIVDGAADGSLVLRGLLGAGNVVVSGTSGLLASLEMEVLEMLVVVGIAVVFSVMVYGTACSTVVFLRVEVAGKKA